jgi:formyltetrahydrofolate deformylase
MPNTATLLIHCPDKPGLVHDVTGFVFAHAGNIQDLQQHIDRETGALFMRIEWSMERFTLAPEEIAPRFAQLGRRHKMWWKLSFSSERQRVAILVTKENHCLYDLLARHEAGELPVTIPCIVSNHETLKPAADRFGIPFHHFPMTRKNKAHVESRQIKLLRELEVDTVVLARYMQILGAPFITQFANRILNIHHSFLPAFVGSKPYHQAHERGVKLIGATSHYVTENLDEGPIIHQDVMPVSHEHTIGDLVRLGRDLEKTVLAKALWWHVTNKVLVYQNKTVVFD